jgi:hypothetical protein
MRSPKHSEIQSTRWLLSFDLILVKVVDGQSQETLLDGWITKSGVAQQWVPLTDGQKTPFWKIQKLVLPFKLPSIFWRALRCSQESNSSEVMGQQSHLLDSITDLDPFVKTPF